MRKFRNGVNANDEFVFHFTTEKGGKGITDSGEIRGASSFSVAGSGVYAGVESNPSWLLKHIPFIGWGLGKTPVRIPIKLQNDMNVIYPIIPIKSVIIKSKKLKFKWGDE